MTSKIERIEKLAAQVLHLQKLAAGPNDPKSVAKLYDEVKDLKEKAEKAKVRLPSDLDRNWPNVLGWLRGLPDQPYYRDPPRGVSPVTPDFQEIKRHVSQLKLWRSNLQKALKG